MVNDSEFRCYTTVHTDARGKQTTFTVEVNRPTEEALDNYARKVLELFKEYERKCVLRGEGFKAGYVVS